MSAGICPYCRYEVFAAEGEHVCPLCEATHHSECWAENGGCAVIGCEALAESPDANKIVITEVDLNETTTQAPSRTSRSSIMPRLSRAMIIAAVFLVVLAVAAAFYLRSITKEEETGPEIRWGKSQPGQLR